jgi:NAD(P)-dependent dehydrogenase (short-subunit alcohol dehydrogenase family)
VTGNFLILGAGGGIGSEVARQLTAGGAKVFLAGRREEPLAKLSEELQAPFLVVDGTDFNQVEQLVKQAAETLGSLHGAANLIGSVLLKPAHLTSPQEFMSVVMTNLASAFALIRSAAMRMDPEGGNLVLMSSAAAHIGLANHEAIASAKGGIEGLVRSAAATYAFRNVRVNAIAPGLVKTPMTERIWNQPKAAEMSKSLHPLGRFGETADIARGVCFLLSPQQSWMTGQILRIDGGLGDLKTLPRTT